MRNVYFALAFMLVSTFTFASTIEVETVEENCVIENVINLDQTFSESEYDCLFEFSWDTDQYGQGSLWIDCGITNDGPFDWNAFLDTILDNFF